MRRRRRPHDVVDLADCVAADRPRHAPSLARRSPSRRRPIPSANPSGPGRRTRLRVQPQPRRAPGAPPAPARTPSRRGRAPDLRIGRDPGVGSPRFLSRISAGSVETQQPTRRCSLRREPALRTCAPAHRPQRRRAQFAPGRCFCLEAALSTCAPAHRPNQSEHRPHWRRLSLSESFAVWAGSGTLAAERQECSSYVKEDRGWSPVSRDHANSVLGGISLVAGDSSTQRRDSVYIAARSCTVLGWRKTYSTACVSASSAGGWA